MTRRDSFLRCTVTLLVVVLLGVIGAALACAPSAPSGQDETPSPTATPTPAPPPTPGTSLDDLPGLDPLLSARVAEYEAAQLSVQGASGQSTAPKMVDIYIGASTGKSRKEILQLLADHGATSVRTHGVTNIYAKVPASLLRTLSERTDIDSMKADPLPYPKIDAGLNGLAVRYAAGLMPDEDTNPTYGRLLIGFNNDATDAQYEAVKRYLLAGGSVMGHDDTIMEEAYKPFLIVAYVPVKLFAGLDSMPGVAEVDQEWPYPVPAEFRITIQDDPPTSENRSGDEATAGAGDTSHAPTRNPKLGPVLNAIIIKRDQQNTDQPGLAGQAAPEERLISVSIDLIAGEVTQVRSFLKDNGGSSSLILIDPNGSYIEGKVPVTSLTRLSQHPDILTVTAMGQLYPNLSDQLNDILAEYEAGFLSAEEAAERAPQHDGQKMNVHFQIKCAHIEDIKAFSRANGSFLFPEQVANVCADDPVIGHIYTSVPITALASLSSQPGVIHVQLIYGSRPMSVSPTMTTASVSTVLELR